MWIICCGMPRSGSTLQYQIASKLIEDAKLGKRVGWVRPEDIEKIFKKYDNYKKFKVIKTHIFSKRIQNEFLNGNAKGLYIYRDIRDVIVSHMNKNNMSFTFLIRNNFLNNILNNYYLWTALPNMYISKYEDVITNLKLEVYNIARFLNINKSLKECNKIANNFSIDKQIARINKLQTSLKNNKYDSVSLLHSDHIFSGDIHYWKRVLSWKQVSMIQSNYKKWLQKNNYFLMKKNINLINNIKSHINRFPFNKYKYYSQNGEDYILMKFFNFKRKGTFIDIGAFDGRHLSNSYSFERIGWKGLCIEPHPDYLILCKKNRPNSICLNIACVGNYKKNKIPFFIEHLGLLSGIKSQRYEEVKERYFKRRLKFTGFKKIFVDAFPLSIIFNKYFSPDHKIDFISIDTEGNELDVLKGINLHDIRPRVILIEANSLKNRNLIQQYLTRTYNYHFAKILKQNLFFTISKKDARILSDISIKCMIERNIHPLGEIYTEKQYLNQRLINDFPERFNERIICKIKNPITIYKKIKSVVRP